MRPVQAAVARIGRHGDTAVPSTATEVGYVADLDGDAIDICVYGADVLICGYRFDAEGVEQVAQLLIRATWLAAMNTAGHPQPLPHRQPFGATEVAALTAALEHSLTIRPSTTEVARDILAEGWRRKVHG